MDLSDLEFLEQSSNIPHEAFLQNPALFYEGLDQDFEDYEDYEDHQDYDDDDLDDPFASYYLDDDDGEDDEDEDDDLARELFGEPSGTDDSQTDDASLASPRTSSSSFSAPSRSSQTQRHHQSRRDPSSSHRQSDPVLESQDPASGLPPLHPQPFPEDPLDQHFLRLQRVTNSLISSSPGRNSPRLDSLRRRIDQHFDGRVTGQTARTGSQADRSGEQDLAGRLRQSMDERRATARRRNHDQFIDDELVEMEVAQPRRPWQPIQDAPGRQTVIDLTDEPDSPVQSQRPLPRPGQAAAASAAATGSRNPRRQASQRRQTPAFTRSDGSILGAGGSGAGAGSGAGSGAGAGAGAGGPGAVPADFIDLTEDSPDEARNPSQPRPRRAQDAALRDAAVDTEVAIMGVFARLNNELPFGNLSPFGSPFGRLFNLLPRSNSERRRANNPPDIEVQIIGHQQGPFAAAMDNPLAGNPVHFDYQALGFGNNHHHAQPPKPPHVPPPPPREGFTRDTGPDTVVICPSCDEELKYDPEENNEDGPPSKKARTKKDREEHHFWAVPACGHVYCRRCYENRRNCIPPKKAKAPEALPKVGFRPGAKPNQVLCAVEDCDSDVSTKKHWVGIFL
ncbi:uncharacterized protein E0L32_003379 [Thyridium curvatum]|uniref:Cell cycle control protein n=1 Tax=Thyridium curvatum TaxID=1093900 RepID=A0A507BAC8_9PEZI|nr:uncharacterized protein E0L32_003379 [Thyridium curvatum]TPX16817.1 hypothetical protein E0L32_003379 [Thyridium curvatum]